jgi:hypothetical protein
LEDNRSPQDIFLGMADDIHRLAQRLAPDHQMIPIKFEDVAAGTTIPANLIPKGGYNGILVALTAGVVNMWFDGTASDIPHVQLTGAGVPYQVPIPARKDSILTFQVDANSPDSARGYIWLIQY